MSITVNRMGPGFPRHDREGDLDQFIDNTNWEFMLLFWNQEELDYFNACALMRGKTFTYARLWKHRPWVDTKQHDYKWVFIRLRQAKPRRLP